jgi:hypothetical protein
MAARKNWKYDQVHDLDSDSMIPFVNITDYNQENNPGRDARRRKKKPRLSMFTHGHRMERL